MLRGMFEERIKGIIDEVKEKTDIILFIDEAHTLMDARVGSLSLGDSCGAVTTSEFALVLPDAPEGTAFSWLEFGSLITGA